MSGQNSILDKIIESQEKQQAASFNPNELVSELLKSISSKEADILSRRFGLSGKQKETLEQIGKHYDITRERIRQIETATVKKLKDLKEAKKHIDLAEQHITHLLEYYGGVMEEKFLLNKVNENISDSTHTESAHFILTKLLNEKIESIKSDDQVLPGWKLPSVSLDTIREAINELVDIVNIENKLISGDLLIDSFRKRAFYQQHKDRIAVLKLGIEDTELEAEAEKIIDSYLRISKHLDQNILGEWGLTKWTSIKPKRMSDKVYLVLRKAGKPLHFTEITSLINQESFDRKIAYPATIHNELILDDRYVLVGRGIYALKEWGYKSGTVLDTIVDILGKAGQPITKEQIVDEVLKQRMVRKSTIFLALTNKSKITKTSDGRYALA